MPLMPSKVEIVWYDCTLSEMASIVINGTQLVFGPYGDVHAYEQIQAITAAFRVIGQSYTLKMVKHQSALCGLCDPQPTRHLEILEFGNKPLSKNIPQCVCGSSVWKFDGSCYNCGRSVLASKDPEYATGFCSRAWCHTGPCSGLPREDCKSRLPLGADHYPGKET